MTFLGKILLFLPGALLVSMAAYGKPPTGKMGLCADFMTVGPSFASAWLTKTHNRVNADVTHPNGLYRYSLGEFSQELYEELLQGGYNPQLMSVHHINENWSLYPSLYGGQWDLSGHQVVVLEGMVYDPLSPIPVSVEEYESNVYGIFARVDRVNLR